jgi:hypothetical protein
MTENETPGAKSFWLTLPGILSGLAALIGAIGSVLTLYFTHVSSPPSSPPQPQPSAASPAPSMPPQAFIPTPAPPPQAYSSTPAPVIPYTSSATVGRWPWTSQRLLQDQDVSGLPKRDLELMRNEIFARHGWVFNRDDLRQYFSGQPWYRPKGTLANRDQANRLASAELTAIEKYNVNFIKQYENR